MRRLVLALTAGLVAASLQPVAAHAAVSVPIAGGTNLTISYGTSVGSVTSIKLASLTVTTAAPGEVRRIRAYVPIEHNRTVTGSDPADRFYTSMSASCSGAQDPSSIMRQTNLLAGSTALHSPRSLLVFPVAGTYTCSVAYKVVTSKMRQETVEKVFVRDGGYLVMSDPLPNWSKQCYWPANTSSAPGCNVASESAVESKKIAAGSTLVRTPVRAKIPPGTDAYIYADANLTTCSGTAGDEGLCLSDEGLDDSSTVVSYIKVNPVGTTAPACRPTFSTEYDLDHYARLDLPQKVHHATLYHVLKIRTTDDTTCPTSYDLTNELTAWSGQAPVISHRNGTLLSVSS